MNTPKAFIRKKTPSAMIQETAIKKKSCFNLEDIMQFEAARQRALNQPPPETQTKPFTEFLPSRIFINEIDTFIGSHLVKVIIFISFIM